ncbi:hypothetical protein UH38_09990 [Aliterella atlantica CENA595]|uniref:Polysaccharide lyase n=2 Tax=Aliterella TaxID=1827277 RepID=A0A0D8ZTB7_9CYAN|nr:hypothetical protein UH38_09990 [Aliterella atlantica CENA595]
MQKQHLSLALLITLPFVLATSVWAYSQNNSQNKLIFAEDFENGDLSKWGKTVDTQFKNKKFTPPGKEDCCQYSVQIATSPTNPSDRVAKFTLYRNDPDVSGSRRSELRLNAVARNSEYWYGFSTYLPADFSKDRSMEIISQWHSKPDKNLGENWRSPPLYLKSFNGHWQIARRWDSKRVTTKNTPEGKETIDLGAYQTGVWTNWVFHVKWSHQADGLVEVWKNGKLVLRKTGPNTYNDNIGPFQKIGIYKPDWKYRPHKSKITQRVVYYDNVRVGSDRASYKDVAP